ncbi:MAG: hydantoinase/oxoprolinase family protein [Pseudomonadales bacterium]|nr:hydantoinase/oxoprolinase family protein [Pseudomonadales bacterium]
MTIPVLGIDTGGTFTDFVVLAAGRLQVHKVLSTPEAPQRAILQGIEELGLTEQARSGNLMVIHGTTVATNAALEGKGVRTVYIGNRGLGDIIRIGRQTRPELYNLTPASSAELIDPTLILEADTRTAADGLAIKTLTDDELTALVEQVRQLSPRSVAVNLLFSYLDPSEEIRIEQALSDQYFVSRSSFVLPEQNEYERGITTWLNAWLGPLIRDYLNELAESLAPSSLSVMQSSGLTIAAKQAARRAVNLLLSGPAGGLSATTHIGSLTGIPDMMTFDMGGTSTDVSLVKGRIRLTNRGKIAGVPVAIPMADIHTIGAGGGSIAYIDEGGLLRVGPESAGASPGPACYGKGGSLPTVTDANLVLGRLQPEAFLGGSMGLDADAARRAITPLATQLGMTVEEVALGIIELANEHMKQALSVISIRQGYDPRAFTLTCFGGAGGLHVCDLADSLDMKRALVPLNSGVFSALGMIASVAGRELIQTCRRNTAELTQTDLLDMLESLREQARAELLAEGHTQAECLFSLDLRYQGQTHALTLPCESLSAAVQAFHNLHEHRYGHRMDRPVEMISMRAHCTVARDALVLPQHEPGEQLSAARTIRLVGIDEPVPVMSRSALTTGKRICGPALITEAHTTILMKKDWEGELDSWGNLLLTKH